MGANRNRLGATSVHALVFAAAQKAGSNLNQKASREGVEAIRGDFMPNNHKPDDGMPDFSGVTGGASTTAKANAVVYETYTVKAGDTLSKIAKKKYGNANLWRLIQEANKDRIKNPDQIQVGWDLKLPAKPE